MKIVDTAGMRYTRVKRRFAADMMRVAVRILVGRLTPADRTRDNATRSSRRGLIEIVDAWKIAPPASGIATGEMRTGIVEMNVPAGMSTGGTGGVTMWSTWRTNGISTGATIDRAREGMAITARRMMMHGAAIDAHAPARI